ncbi:hypothetical protein [uncultured Pseudoteredinibacter sp.]|uniref:hypothetical protein n=1 Tax=uncultured Pseudoteredinibacter sp. TaxID=1641701 RepID=UPI0026088F13|nr:hypothetical protein [uncultured Pseudoteredinibacter sp.]
MTLGSYRRRQSGVALVMVMWLVAAMSLMVASVVYVARMDVKQQQLDQEMIRAGALFDKAMRLSMRQFKIDTAENNASKQIAQQYFLEHNSSELKVEIYPASGLIHLGSLTPELLVAVLQFGVGVEGGELASFVELIGGGFSSAAIDDELLDLPNRFRALEDLLLIPGITVDRYELLKDYFYIGQSGAPGVNPAAAPKELLSILAEGDETVVDEFLMLREEALNSGDGNVIPHAQFSTGMLSSADSSVYRVDVSLAADKYAFQQRYWISMMQSREGLPWKVKSKEPVRSVESR